MKNVLKKIFKASSFALEVAEAPVRGYGDPDKNGALHFDVNEPENQHSWLGRHISGDGPDRFFSTSRKDFQEAIQNSQEKQKPLLIVASPFNNKEGCHNVLFVMEP